MMIDNGANCTVLTRKTLKTLNINETNILDHN